MATGASTLNSTIKIGDSTVVIYAFYYGGNWITATATVDGVSNPINNGTTYISVGGIVLEFYRTNVAGAPYGTRGSGTITCKFKNAFNTYESDWVPENGTDFLSMTNISVGGSDETAVTNSLTVKLPVLREVLI